MEEIVRALLGSFVDVLATFCAVYNDVKLIATGIFLKKDI